MSDFAKEQIKKLKTYQINGDIPDKLVLPKVQTMALTLGECYLIKIDKSLTKENKSVLTTNWNHNTYPKYEYLKCQVTQIIGNLVRMVTVGYDYQNNVDINDVWEGYLPTESIKIILKLR